MRQTQLLLVTVRQRKFALRHRSCHHFVLVLFADVSSMRTAGFAHVLQHVCVVRACMYGGWGVLIMWCLSGPSGPIDIRISMWFGGNAVPPLKSGPRQTLLVWLIIIIVRRAKPAGC